MSSEIQKPKTDADKQLEFMQMLHDYGYDNSNSIILRPETACEITTDERLRILEKLKQKTYSSINELARDLERDASAVKRDLDLFVDKGLIRYKKHNGAKKPILKRKHIFIKPI